ncbi:MAG: heme-binding domain-containing protein, partial [Nitrospiria bacterium]
TFILIQIIPVSRNNPLIEQDVTAPKEVKNILRRSCYDCHSNETKWPWYSYIAPVSWLIAYDIYEARDELNFSTWQKYRSKEKRKIRKDIWDEVEDGDMPLVSYLLMHPNARLSREEKRILRHWANSR